jgi:hypothetical protein
VAFPTVESTATTNRTAAETTAVVTLPATVSAGATLIVLGRVTVVGSTTWPAGWTKADSTADASDDITVWAWKKADGNEDGTTINVTIPSGKSAWIAYSIIGARDPTVQPPLASGMTTSTNTNPNPQVLNASGTPKDFLWLWMGGWEGEQTSPPTGQPTNYTDPIGANTGTASAVTTNCRVASARRALTAASEDPPAWTISASDDWVAFTVAVFPVVEVPAGVGTKFVRSQAVQRASRW